MINASEIADLLGRDVEINLNPMRRDGGKSAQCVAERERSAERGKTE